MKPNGNGGNGSHALGDLRKKVIDAVRICYVDPLKHVDAFDELVFGQPTEELSVAALQYLFAFNQLPYAENVKKVDGKSRLTGISKEEGTKLARSISDMQASGEIDCCEAFNGKTAEESARAVHAQLKLIGKKIGVAGRLVWLRVLLNSEHLPNVDIAHPCQELPRGFAIDGISNTLAENADLFAELTTLMQRGASSFTLSHWVVEAECDKETRAALIAYIMSRSIHAGGPGIGMVINAGAGSLVAALASAMASRRGAADRPN